MKKLVLATTMGLVLSTSYAAELKSFDQVSKAVSGGKGLTYVLNLNECQSNLPAQDIITSVKPDAFMVINKQRITAAFQHFSLNQPGAVGLPTFTNAKYDISADGKANIKITIMKAADYSAIMEYSLQCELGQGLTVFDNPSA
ncbi:VirK family protein [Legionella gresilensis]|uniref:VirK family protein n=1 Tax=Legionella gresilensis TaxID=91823 RepID=UPI0010411D58|nr:VirK family protein [Legionella gresilensis]